MKSLKKQFTLNISISLITNGINIIVGILIFPLIISHLDAKAFGIYSILKTLNLENGFFNIFEFGTTSAMSKQTSEANNNSMLRWNIFFSAQIFTLVFSIIVALAVYLFTASISTFLGLPSEYEGIGIKFIYLCAILIPISTIGNLATGFLLGINRVDITKWIDVMIKIITSAATLTIIQKDGSFFHLSLVAISSPLLRAVLSLAVIVYQFLKLPQKRLALSYGYFKRTMALGSKHLIGKFSAITMRQAPLILLSHFSTIEAVSVFEIISKIPKLIKSSLGVVSNSVKPILEDIKKTKSQNKINNLINMSLIIQLSILVPILASISLFSKEILTIWISPDHSQYSILLTFSMLWPLFIIIANIFNSTLTALKSNLESMPTIWLINTFGTITLYITLTYHYQLIGALLGFILSALLTLIIYYKEGTKYFKLSFPTFSAFTKSLFGLFFLSGMWKFLNSLLYFNSLTYLAILLSSYSCFCYVFMYTFLLSPRLKGEVVKVLKKQR